jgi:nitrogen regulatory protein PII
MNEKSLLVVVLNKVELLDPMLSALNDANIKGATVLNSIGMAHELAGSEDNYVIGSLRAMFASGKRENKTIFMVIDNDRIIDATQVIDQVIDLQKPDTGILFALPVMFAAGIPEWKSED